MKVQIIKDNFSLRKQFNLLTQKIQPKQYQIKPPADIQDIPGVVISKRGYQPIMQTNFPENYMEMKKIGPRGKGRVQNLSL